MGFRLTTANVPYIGYMHGIDLYTLEYPESFNRYSLASEHMHHGTIIHAATQQVTGIPI